jgi:CubicO group peptidase (beta-lactamase class C family)
VPAGNWLVAPQRPEWAAIRDRIGAEFPDVRAVVICTNGTLDVEHYFAGATARTKFNVKSVTKSVLSVLTGIAIDRHILPGVDAPLSMWLPEARATGVDPRVAEITIRHVLEMSTGFDWEENGPSTAQWLGSDDQLRAMLRMPVRARPGTAFNYSSGVAHLLSVVLTRAARQPTLDFATQYLFAPIGMMPGSWGRDRQGYAEGGSELELTARDMLRFGLLMLNRGRWGGHRVVSDAWVLESTRPHKRIDYAFLWNFLPREWGGPAVSALGYGGQVISIVPDARAVIVIASTTTNASNDVMRLLRETLLPFVRRAR